MVKILRADSMKKCIGCFTCMLICAAVHRKNHSIRKSCIHVRTSGGLSGRFVATVCHACQDPPCAEACPSGALTPRPGGGATLHPTECIGCRRCESACMVQAIGYDSDTHKPIICLHCGICAQYCPHGCLTVLDTLEVSSS